MAAVLPVPEVPPPGSPGPTAATAPAGEVAHCITAARPNQVFDIAFSAF
jgi:hypothetical protein